MAQGIPTGPNPAKVLTVLDSFKKTLAEYKKFFFTDHSPDITVHLKHRMEHLIDLVGQMDTSYFAYSIKN